MAQKHLHELLQEDQEPFQLKHYIADRRCQLKRLHKYSLQTIKKQKPISTSSTLFCKHACFFPTIRDSPNCLEKSPINFSHSPAKSPVRKVFLHIPAATSSLLLEAAMRIQQKQNRSRPKKTQIGFGLFGSILKKIKEKHVSKKNNITNGVRMRAEETGATAEPRSRFNNATAGWAERHMTTKILNSTNGVTNETGAPKSRSSSSASWSKRQVSKNHDIQNGIMMRPDESRLSSAGWSESNEEKSMDFETSSSSKSDNEEIDQVHGIHDEFDMSESEYCSSTLSPFRFSLQKCSSSTGCRTQEFSSPVASPGCHKNEDNENYEGLANIGQEDDEKEQCSPVSVLDPPFDDDDGHECEYADEDEDEEDDDCGIECSYALVQRAQQQLLYKLRRFEKLAELDPIELEKLMLEEEEEGNDDPVDDNGNDVDDMMLSYTDSDFETFASDMTIPFDMKRLVTDLISEEKSETKSLNNREEEVVFGRVCKRLDSWQHVRSDTVDMMVEFELKNELDEWKNFQGQREETALEVEVSIFRLLVEELAEEIVHFVGNHGICNEVLA
ncbi:unnamed protein product [Withania somnifera]